MEEKNEIEELNQSLEVNTEIAEVANAEVAPLVVETESELAQPSEDTAEVVAQSETTESVSEVQNPELPTDGNFDSSAKWYVLHTFSGYENVAKENLEIVIDKFNLQNRIFEIVIPMEDVVEEKNGKRKIVTRKLMPGYVLVKMIYGDDIWHAVTRTRGITGFTGPKGRPLNLTDEEIRKMHLEKHTVVDISIAPNDKVEVLEGPLNGFAGTVISVDAVSAKCRVVVEMFGRETPVDLSLTQIRKIN